MYWDPMWGILILADFRPMGISFHAVIVFGLGKDLLFESVLGRCDVPIFRKQFLNISIFRSKKVCYNMNI